MLGLIGKKLGHTRVYDANGVDTPVTVVLAGPNRVLQVKTQAARTATTPCSSVSANKNRSASPSQLGIVKFGVLDAKAAENARKEGERHRWLAWRRSRNSAISRRK